MHLVIVTSKCPSQKHAVKLLFFSLLVSAFRCISASLHVISPPMQEWTAKAHFTHHAHTASISAVATSERFVVTGSKDETIQLYDMKKRIEHGALLHHDGEYLRSILRLIWSHV